MKLKDLHTRLEKLRQSAAAYDAERKKSTVLLFDDQLFNASSRFLSPCVHEAKDNLRQLSSPSISLTKAQYLADRLVAQLEALERALAPFAQSNPNAQESQDLHSQLRQHKEWEARLCALVRHKESLLGSGGNKDELEQEWQVAEQRLQRCRAALLNIEHQINESEKFL
ncbi:primosomal replication protein [Vibrio methylphosphonaticus]|uniref:primosomal replication protein n=1 Tax=Vibrio methylphosphonaticus TaxID=2946866 RepID=UPI00202A1163|nr:primosomal replication protein [Vibrio methylphosphonaticus]MCL9774382.1 primosomal replication protein [Vibrio methylphosphonaticus]